MNASIAGIRERVQAIDEKLDTVILQRGQIALDYVVKTDASIAALALLKFVLGRGRASPGSTA